MAKLVHRIFRRLFLVPVPPTNPNLGGGGIKGHSPSGFACMQQTLQDCCDLQ
jgi:hypothetical protein